MLLLVGHCCPLLLVISTKPPYTVITYYYCCHGITIAIIYYCHHCYIDATPRHLLLVFAILSISHGCHILRAYQRHQLFTLTQHLLVVNATATLACILALRRAYYVAHIATPFTLSAHHYHGFMPFASILAGCYCFCLFAIIAAAACHVICRAISFTTAPCCCYGLPLSLRMSPR